ncbi:MAG: hypothetical protein RSE34_02330 [Brevundimonas sp.]
MGRSNFQDLMVRLRRGPLSTLLAIIVVIVALRILGEFASGVVDGLIVGFTDAV